MTNRQKISRRDFLKLGGAGLAGAALFGVAGCGGGGQGGANELIFSWGPDDTGALTKMIEKFNQQNEGGLRVTYREMPSDTGQYFDQLRTEFQAGGGEIDIITGDVIWPAQFAAQGWIADLSDRFTDTNAFLDGPLQSNTYDGKVWGVPWYTDAGLLYYRQDLLEQAGFSEAPATWEEVQEMAVKARQDAGARYGFVFQGAEYEGGVCNGLEYIWTHGGDVLDGNTVVVDSPESAAGLETEHSMIMDGVAPKAVSTYKETETDPAFLNGNAVFARNWPYMYALAGTEDYPKVKPEQLGVAALPIGEGGRTASALGGWNMLINANSQNQDNAWEFAQWMTAPEQMKFRALEATILPTRKSLYEDQEILNQVPVIRLGKEALENSKPRPVSPFYSDMSLKMAEQFNKALKGDVSPEQAVKTLQQELSAIIEAGG